MRLLRYRSCLVLTLAIPVLAAAQSDPPLHQRIDQAIAEAHCGDVAGVAGDAEFLRRVSIDLVGRSPSPDEVHSFLDNGAAEKRASTIDRLIASDEFVDYFAGLLDVMFMERRGGNRIPQNEWLAFLRQAMAEKWSFDHIVYTMVTADGTGESRGAAKFLVERQVESHALTRDIGRIFLGRDLQCAQCHNHPNIPDYEQSEYYGVLSFVNRSYLFEDPKDNKKSYVGEKADGEAEFKSVFTPDDDPSKSLPHLLSGLALDVEPRFDGEQPYVVAPTKEAAGVPKFSRRGQLARLITHPDNEHFAKNVVNRMWAHMFGRGLVEPVDFHHSDNPPSHPALLQMLADDFVASNFDLRELLRQIALSRTYQRSVDFPAISAITANEFTTRIAALDASIEQLKGEVADASVADFRSRLKTRRATVASIDEAIAADAQRLSEHESKRANASKQRGELQKQLKQQEEQHQSLTAAVAAANKVAEAFPKDKSLQQAHADYRQRADQLGKEIEAKKNKVAERDKELQTSGAEIDSLKRQLAKQRAQRIGYVDMVAEARGALSVFRERERLRKAQLSEQKQQRQVVAEHDALTTKRAGQQRAAEQLAAHQASRPTEAEEELPRLTAAVTTAEQQVAAQRATVDTLTQAQLAKEEELAERKKSLAALDNAVAQARTAAADLGDEQLKASVAALEEQQQGLAEELAASDEATQQTENELQKATAELQRRTAELTKSQADQEAITARLADYDRELKSAEAALDAAKAEVQLAEARLRETWERRFAVRSLAPLSPEQLAGSTISALRLKPRFQSEAENEWQGKNKDKKPEEIDQSKKADEIATLAKKRSDQVVSTFVSLFAAPGGAPQDVFSATADQALFWSNDGKVQGWLSPAKGTLMERLQSIDDAQTVAEELYLAILARPANELEIASVEEYLEQRTSDRNKALQELAWGMLSSLEFRFNH